MTGMTMNKIEKFKKALYEFVGCNKQLVEDLKRANENKSLVINLKGSYRSGACYINGYHSVDIGLNDVPQIYNKCTELSAEFDDNVVLSLNGGYSDYGNPDCIQGIVYVYEDSGMPPTEMLESCSFLQKEKITKQDSITLLSYMFALYHELGHVIKNSNCKGQLDREYAADAYAYNCVKSYCKEKNENQRKAIILSTIISISSILYKRTEKEDTEHPHSIERIYLFLQSMKFDDSSFVWEYSFNVIQDWCKHNNIDTAFIHGGKCGYKAKIIQFYDHFKKK